MSEEVVAILMLAALALAYLAGQRDGRMAQTRLPTPTTPRPPAPPLPPAVKR